MKKGINNKKRTGRPSSQKFVSFRAPAAAAAARPEEGDIAPETELETTSSLTRPPGPTRHTNQSTRSSKRRCLPKVEEVPPSCSSPESLEQRSASARKEKIVQTSPPPEEEAETSENAVGAHKVRGIPAPSISNIDTEEYVSRDMSGALSRVSSSSNHHDIIVPTAHVVDESNTITAYMVDPAAAVLYGDGIDGIEKQPLDEAVFSCVCPCIACQVSGIDSKAKKRCRRLLFTATVIVLAALAATFVTLAAKRIPHEELRDLIAEASPDGGVSLENPDSYQYAAFSWLRGKTSRLLPRYRSSEAQMIEAYALACFYYSLGGDGWVQNEGWMAHGGSLCDWFNVTCSNGPNGNVTAIRFIENNLRGEVLVPELVMLKSIETLYLDSNHIESPIPEEMGDMSSLFELVLRNNSIQGTVPNSFSKLSNLQYLKLHRNKLSGSFPIEEISPLKNLTYLTLGDNIFSRTLPAELAAMKGLQVLKLYQNGFNSTIPTELGEMTSLKMLDLNWNNFTSTIPSELGNLKKLERLRLQGNMLVGSLPASICNITRNIVIDCVVQCNCCKRCI